MSAIQIENHFLMLKFVQTASSYVPLLVKSCFLNKISNLAVIDVVKDLESFDHISSHVTVY